MTHISNTQAPRSYAEEDEHDRIDALLDQALKLSFPCSDPVAITISRIYYRFRRKAATDSEAIRPRIPTEVGHPFRLKLATL